MNTLRSDADLEPYKLGSGLLETDDFQTEETWVRVATSSKSQTINICRPGFNPRDGQEYDQRWRIARPNAPLTRREYQRPVTIDALVQRVEKAGGCRDD
jgi:hypothetical protein